MKQSSRSHFRLVSRSVPLVSITLQLRCPHQARCAVIVSDEIHERRHCSSLEALGPDLPEISLSEDAGSCINIATSSRSRWRAARAGLPVFFSRHGHQQRCIWSVGAAIENGAFVPITQHRPALPPSRGRQGAEGHRDPPADRRRRSATSRPKAGATIKKICRLHVPRDELLAYARSPCSCGRQPCRGHEKFSRFGADCSASPAPLLLTRAGSGIGRNAASLQTAFP